MLMFKSKLTRLVGSMSAGRQRELNRPLAYALQLDHQPS
jgi:hypothetical protein